MLLLLFSSLAVIAVASSGRVYIVFDSCGYEVAKALNKLYPEASGDIFFSWQLSSLPHGAVAVLLATNISSKSDVEVAMQLVKSSGASYIYTDAVNSTGYRVNASDAWLYCIYKDGEALKRIAMGVAVNSGGGVLTQLGLGLLIAVAVFSAASLALYQTLREKIEELLKRVRVVAPPILRVKVSREEALNHPLRKALYETISSAGAVRYAELMRFGSRATIEWHLWVLLRSGLVAELRVGRKRYIVDMTNLVTALNTLVQVDEEVKCIVESGEKPPKLLTELCNTDLRAVFSVLELYSKAKAIELNHNI